MRGRVLVVEGNDGAGKTTFVRELAAAGWWTLKARARPDFGEWLLQTLQHLPAGNVVFDRFHWSELVYAQTEGRECRLSFEQFVEVEHALKMLQARILWLDTPPEECFARSRAKDPGDRSAGYDDHEWPLERFELTHGLYRSIARTSNVTTVRASDLRDVAVGWAIVWGDRGV